MKSMYNYSVVVCARWEELYIVEWLNYYRAIGFDHVFLYCNDDDPRVLYERVLPFVSGQSPFVTFGFYPIQGHQLQMYNHFLESYRHLTEWVAFFDVDEYLRLPPRTKIDEFVRLFGSEVDCILFNWVFFGPDGHMLTPGRSILSDYRHRQDALHPFTKYVVRSAKLTGPNLSDVHLGHGFWHCPIGKIDQTIKVVNVLGEEMSTYYDGFPEASSKFVNDPQRKRKILDLALIHHYAFRTERAFQDRVERGLGGAFDGQRSWGDVAKGEGFPEFLKGLNEVADLSLASFWPDYLEAAGDLNVMDDAPLANVVNHDCTKNDEAVKLLSNCISLGINCELGIIQKAVGVTKLGLLDWFATHPENLLEMLRSRFEGVGNSDQTRLTVLNDEYMIEDIRYNLKGHSFVRPSEVTYQKFFDEICGRLKFLKRKMIEELEEGAALFVYKLRDTPINRDLLNDIAMEVALIGPGILLSISDSNYTKKPNQYVEWAGVNLLAGNLEKLAPYDCANDVDLPGWISIIKKASLMIEKKRKRGNMPSGFIQNLEKFLISKNKPAIQSSISEWSTFPDTSRDASEGLNGIINGRGKFHTEIEESPWWQVDLKELFFITEIKLYNRMDQPAVAERASKICIEIGIDQFDTNEVFRRESDEPFGGIDGNPLIFKPTIPIPGRFVRIRLLTRNYLHLDQVEVYGEPLPIAISPVQPNEQPALL